MSKTRVEKANAPLSKEALDQLLQVSDGSVPVPSDALRRAVLDDFVQVTAPNTTSVPIPAKASMRWLSWLAEIFEVPPASLAVASLFAAMLGGGGAVVSLTGEAGPATPEEELLILAEDFAWPNISMETGDEG